MAGVESVEDLELKVFVWIKTSAHKNQKHFPRLVVLGWNEPVQDEDDGENEPKVEGVEGHGDVSYICVGVVGN